MGVDILPTRGEVKAATTFLKKFRIILKATKRDIKDDGKDIISILESNNDIDKQAAATKDTLSQQLEAIVTGTQQRMSDLVQQIFGPNHDPTIVADDEVQLPNAFISTYHGGFLDDLLSDTDLIPQMEKQMKTWTASQIISILGYALLIDSTPLENPLGAPGTVCHAEGGIPVSGGCDLFRIGAVAGSGTIIDGAEKANDIFALNDTHKTPPLTLMASRRWITQICYPTACLLFQFEMSNYEVENRASGFNRAWIGDRLIFLLSLRHMVGVGVLQVQIIL